MPTRKVKRVKKPTCKIPNCDEPAVIDNICAKHAARIYTRERARFSSTVQDLLPAASPDMIAALVMQLEHLMQMKARMAVKGFHFEMNKVEEPEAEEETPPKELDS